MTELLLSDAWWAWTLKTYSISIALIWALLKCLAILHPGTPTNRVMDYLSGVFKK